MQIRLKEITRIDDYAFGGVPASLPRLGAVETHDGTIILGVTIAHHSGLIIVGTQLIRVGVTKVVTKLGNV